MIFFFLSYPLVPPLPSLLFFFLHNTYFPSQQELALKRELEQMK